VEAHPKISNEYPAGWKTASGLRLTSDADPRGSRPQLRTKSGLRHTDELLVTRFAIQPIVATLVLFIAGRGIAQVMTNDDLQVFTNDVFQFIALGHRLG
jgi:hypothetical protein